MKTERFDLWQPDEYTYPATFGFMPNVVSCLHDEDTTTRPCVIVVPGGAYRIVSHTEGMIVAKEFFNKGYQTFVCTYTTNLLGLAPLKTQPLKDLSRAVRFVRSRAAEFCVDPERLAVCGFSAGGHLCGSLAVHYADVPDGNPAYAGVSNRPDAAILSYPVITSGEMAHRDSFCALFGDTPTEDELAYMSLEKHVKPDTPPCFLWQTATDELVPVENSYLMAAALKEKGVPFAHHVFSQGQHGISLADEQWANGEFGEPFTMEQVFSAVEKVRGGEIPMSEDARKQFLDTFDSFAEMPKNSPNQEARIWPTLAAQWLEQVL